MNKIIIFFVILMTSISAVQAAIYRWTDENGIVNYSDIPQEGAEKITLPKIDGYNNTVPNFVERHSPQHTVVDDEYDSLVITQPENDATIRNNQGYVTVVSTIEPALKKGNKLQLILDGKPLGQPQANNIFVLNNIERGTHTLAVQAVNDEGNKVIISDVTTIHMQRPRIGMVPQTRIRPPAP